MRQAAAEMAPPTKAKLANKLIISPLDQELKNLGPLSPSKNPILKTPVFTTKYSHREMVLPPKKVSPSTRIDPEKPRILSKEKALKLVLLQKTIN
jgi:hypothetical protein